MGGGAGGRLAAVVPSDASLAGRFGIGVFGRVRPDKGSDIYVEAMLELLPDFPDFTAVIAGVTVAAVISAVVVAVVADST